MMKYPIHLRDSLLKIGLITLFSCLLINLGYFTQRQSFGQLIGLYTGLFVLYYCLIYTFKNAREAIITGIFFRILLLFAIPALSDDFYRFVWDGRLLSHGLNPYTILPAEFVQSIDFKPIIGDKSIFDKLNSPNYYTVYPPLNQFIFGISAWLSPNNLWLNVIFLRVFILSAEVGILLIIAKLSAKKIKLSSNPKVIALYAFNPLIIIELCGNLHFEGVVMFFVVWAFYVGIKERFHLFFSAFLFACAVCVKLLPLVFIPLVIKKIGFKKGIWYGALVATFCGFFFLPFFDKALIEKLFSSVNLYFQKFEFNASIYYLLREVGYWIWGYNIIGFLGKTLAFITFSSIILISWKVKDIHQAALFILTLYFAMATTIHPWYATNLLVIAIFTNFRYPILWSYTVFFSYAAYQTDLYQENLYLVILEYVLVLGMMIYELKQVSNLFHDKSS